MITSGLDFTYKVPPFTGKDWKQRLRRRSPRSLCGTAALMGPSPHCAGREGVRLFKQANDTSDEHWQLSSKDTPKIIKNSSNINSEI